MCKVEQELSVSETTYIFYRKGQGLHAKKVCTQESWLILMLEFVPRCDAFKDDSNATFSGLPLETEILTVSVRVLFL